MKMKSKRASTTKKRKYVIRKSSGDLVEIQIAVIFHKKPRGAKITKELVDAMIRHKAKTSRGVWKGGRVEGAHEGENPKGVDIKIIRWRNPDRLAEEDAGWRSGSQADAWGSLRQVTARAQF